MNKKVLSAILFSALFAGTGTFTSCIDNDEPAGIEELRGAKATLLAAKAEVAKADAALVLAQAETEKALAAKVQAEAKIKEAEAKIKEAEAEAEEAATAEAKAEAEQRIAEIKQEMAEAAVEHESAMLGLKTTLAENQRTYELVLAKIAIAKELFPLDAQFELSSLKEAVETWTAEVKTATEEMEDAQKAYNDAVVDYEYFGKFDEEALQLELDNAKKDLADAQAKLDEYENWLEEDAATKDWRAEVDELTVTVDSLTKLHADNKLAVTLAENSTEYKALKKAAADAAVPATVDSVYGYKYLGDDYATTLYAVVDNGVTITNLSNGEEEVTEEAAELAGVEKAMGKIAVFDKDSVLQSGNKLYNDKKYLASFTAEVRHFLDTIAATAAADTTLKANSDAAIKAWKEAMTAYNAADTTMKAELDTVNTAMEAWNELNDKSAKKVDALRKALLDYLTVAKKNGAKLNNVLTSDGIVEKPLSVEDGVIKYDTLTAYSLQDPLEVLKDTTKTYVAMTEFGVGFTSSNEEKADAKVLDKATGKDKKFAYYKNVIAEDAPTTEELLNALVIASDKAFGDADLYHQDTPNYQHGSKDYLHVQPTEEDVKNIVFFNGYSNEEIHAAITETTNGVVGAYGKYLIAKDDNVLEYAQNYKNVIADLQAAITYWEATYKTLNAKYTAWETAKKAANKALADYEEANINNLTEKTTELDEEITRLGNIKTALQTAISTYLPELLKGNTYGEVAFKTALETIIAKARLEVNSKARSVASAQKAVDLNESESYSELVSLEEALDNAIADLKEAQAELDKALDNLAKALEIYEATITE